MERMRAGLSKDLIARVLGGAPKWTTLELESRFPARQLPDGAFVTRVAPSPTGFMHLGTLYQMLIAKKLAAQSGGVFFLRIEDTDTKREVAGATDIILKCAREFSLTPDEGPEFGGEYGPYFQSQRRDIYHSVAAELLARGQAYPCFLSADDMEKIRDEQKMLGLPTGIYGDWARDREILPDEILARLDAGEVPSIRLYSTGDRNTKIFYNDKVRGRLAFPENDEDIVLIKSNDGLPTYHFAHLCDDHFMRTTLVQRGEEWLASLNLHLQLFRMMNWDAPEYIHVATINKLDDATGNSRKLSKRTDPEANTMNYLENGWPVEAVLNYLFNIVASGFEEEHAKKPNTTIWNYPIKIKKIPQSPALFNMQKLEWWAREFIATLPVDELTRRVVAWADEYSQEWAKILGINSPLAGESQSELVRDAVGGKKCTTENSMPPTDAQTRASTPPQGGSNYLSAILGIERDNPKRVRKDFINWRQTLEQIEFFFDEKFNLQSKEYRVESIDKEVLKKFLETFNINDDKDAWWEKIQAIAAELGISNGDAAMALRVAITGRTNTPDLYSIMQVMGDTRVRTRIQNAAK
ncbi:MAG: hypothetical protein LBR41_02020 [Rickettsiales bacterium]|jgi:glutamyl-tRNA synthetase|nr:hypothetical protein [Rickettsiales bacterium]